MENSKEKYWKEVREQNYINVMDVDCSLVIKLIDIARGKKSLERFLHDNKLSCSCISNVIYGQVKRMHVKDIVIISQNLPSGSPVTKKLLLAANGIYEKEGRMVSLEKMTASIQESRKMIRALDEPIKKSSMSASKKYKRKKLEQHKGENSKKAEIMAFPVEYDSYEAFIDDLSFYGKRQPESVLFFLKKNQRRLFADKDFCRVLSLYRKYADAEKEQRVSDLKAFYENGTDVQECKPLSNRYKLILDTYCKA